MAFAGWDRVGVVLTAFPPKIDGAKQDDLLGGGDPFVFAHQAVEALHPLINDVHVVGEGQSRHVVVKVSVVHGFPEQKLSCFLSPLSLVSDVSEASAVTGHHRHLGQFGQSGQGGYSVGLKAISVPASVVSALLSSSPLPSRDRSVRSALRSLLPSLVLKASQC